MSARPGRRRAAVALALALVPVVLAAAFAGPAAAHPPEGAIVVRQADGEALDGEATGQPLAVDGQFRHSNPDAPLIERIDLTADAEDLDPDCPDPVLPSVEGEAAVQRFAVELPPFACNGTWTVTATATTGDAGQIHGRESGTADATFALAQPPLDPTGLEAVYADVEGQPRAVTLTWTANPEPDVVGYRVERLEPGADTFESLGLSPPGRSPRFVDDELVEVGEHAYRLIALRSGATAEPEDRLASAGGDQAVVEVAAPRPTTTTSSTPAPAGPGSTGTTTPRPGPTSPGATLPLRPPTTRDGGFTGTLPFDPSRTTTSIVPGAPVDPATTVGPAVPGDGAVVALTEGDDDGGPGPLLVPVAVSLPLLLFAAHVRHLVHRSTVAEEHLPPL